MNPMKTKYLYIAAAAASNLGSCTCAVLRPFAEPRLNRRVEECFDHVLFFTDGCEPAAFFADKPADMACVALGRMLAASLGRYTPGRILSLCPGGDIELPVRRKAETVAQLVFDTIRRNADGEHDIRIL